MQLRINVLLHLCHTLRINLCDPFSLFCGLFVICSGDLFTTLCEALLRTPCDLLRTAFARSLLQLRGTFAIKCGRPL